jgi:phospholipase C
MLDRRRFLAGGAVAAAAMPPSIARALSIGAHSKTGSIRDVEHVVILMQENRGFDHYFGPMAGVRGFADRFPIPLPGGRTVWTQQNAAGPGRPPYIAPFPLNTTQTFAHMRVEGTPHGWPDSQAAWDEGRMSRWPAAKGEHAMGHYEAADIPFQYALADAFTLCDAYHCSIQAGTNTNRLFLFSATHDPLGQGGGPSLTNSHDSLPPRGAKDPYTWTTYLERLSRAGVSWKVYQDMLDNFGDNPLIGFKVFRDADPRSALKQQGLSTWKLDALRADVMANKLPQISHIVAPAKDSEHPGPSSPAQGADFIARVLDALTADPKVWARTVLFVMYDENDGFFDHAPPPAPPSKADAGVLWGGSTVDLTGEHHLVKPPASEEKADLPELYGRPYGLGARVPMYVVSPFSRGGFVNSQVFDHTSVIRFCEARFGVMEPNITPWRRAVCGDLTSAFDFRNPNRKKQPVLPSTTALAARAAALPGRTKPPTPATVQPPEQAVGVKPSRALPYELEAACEVAPAAAILTFANTGVQGAVFHVYDLTDLTPPPKRYTVESGKRLQGAWALGPAGYDLWVLGPNGFHRRFKGAADPGLAVAAAYDRAEGKLTLALRNLGARPVQATVGPNAYQTVLKPWPATLPPGAMASHSWELKKSGGWYDVSVTVADTPGWLRRLAGRVETGHDTISDPAMGGPAHMTIA